MDELLHDRSKAEKAAGQPHIVHFYETRDALCDVVAEFVGAGLGDGEPVVMITTASHRVAFEERLRANGVDVVSARASGQLTVFDAEEMLARFMVGSMPDWERFRATIGGVLEKIVRDNPGRRIHAYGEMVDVLWQGGNSKAAIKLEEMWNDLQRTHAFSLLCAYVMASFYKESDGLRRVCATHTHVRSPARTREASSDAEGSGPHVRALAAEIAQRIEIERALRESLEDLTRTEKDLRRTKAELDDFVENAPIPLHSVGADGRIAWANRAELELLGYTREEYVGRHVVEVHVDRAVAEDILARLARREALRDYEARLRAKDGSIRHVAISSNAEAGGGRIHLARCFTRDITLRKNVEDALRDNERRLQVITDSLPVLVSYVDTDHRYRFMNRTYERWLGVSREESLGRHLCDVLGDTLYAEIRERCELALSGQTVTFQTLAAYPTAGERFIDASYVPHVGDDGRIRGFIALVADITEQKQLERVRDRAAARTERLMKITSAMADAVTHEQVFEAVVDEVAAALESSTAALWLLRDGEAPTAELVHASGYSLAALDKFGRVPLSAAARFPALDAIRTGKPIFIDSQEELVTSYPHLVTAVTPGRDYRIACLPIIVEGRTLGSLGFTFDGASSIDADDRSFLLLIARYSGQAIERLRLLEAERHSRAAAEASAARTAMLSAASRAFAEAGVDLSTLVDSIVDQVTREYADACGVTLLSEDGDTVELVRLHHRDGAADADAATTFGAQTPPAADGPTGRVLATGQPLFLPRVDPDALLANIVDPAHRAWLERNMPRSIVLVPMRARGKVVGSLGAMRTSPERAFALEDVELLQELAERAAMAIDDVRLYRDNQDARRRAELLYGLAAAVIGAGRKEDVLDAALDAIQRALGTDRAAILAFDADAVMRFKAWRGLSDPYRLAVEGHSPWPRDVHAPQPVLVPDVRADEGLRAYQPLFERERIGALAFVPLVASGRLIGKFMAYYEAPRELSAREIEIARAIAHHVAAALQRFAFVAELEETLRFNEMFTGVLGHDLRNPLNAIMTAAQLALRRGESEKMVKPLARILTSGDRMARMIDQLLDFTRVRVGSGIPVERRRFDLVPLVRQVIDELDDANPDWQLGLEHAGDAEGPWDSDRLLQVFSNLVANAVQHGIPKHGVRVRIDGTRAELVRVEIHNMGAIPHDLLPKLFDPMSGGERRGGGSRGLGLGLYITQQIVKAHGGSIEVRSTDEDGTTFAVALPRARAASRQGES